MRRFRWIRRFRQSRGYGVHSPFAYELIRKVRSSGMHYYAFDEIADYLAAHHPGIPLNLPLHHLSFRLVNHFKAKDILEIHSGSGVNSLYLSSPGRDIHCTCVEESAEQIALARELTAPRSSQFTLLSQLPEEGTYDAIFIHFGEGRSLSPDSLLRLSGPDTFWVVYPVNTPRSKQFWRNVVNDERVGITFDMKDIGIAFLRQTYSKLHYFI